MLSKKSTIAKGSEVLKRINVKRVLIYENTEAMINIDSVLAANESQSLENTGEIICHTKLV